MTDVRKITMEDNKIQAWDLDRLKPAEHNHKKHSDETTTKLAKSLADIGQIQPVIVDKEGEIIAGHGRLIAARRLGWSKIKVIQVPVSREIAIKARIADNLMSNQDIDNENLSIEINKLMEIDVEVDVSSLILDDDMAKLHKMNQEADYDIDESALSQSVSDDTQEFAEEGEKMMEDANEAMVPIRTVLGFNEVTARQARALKDFMAIVVDERPEGDAAAALVGWVEEVM